MVSDKYLLYLTKYGTRLNKEKYEYLVSVRLVFQVGWSCLHRISVFQLLAFICSQKKKKKKLLKSWKIHEAEQIFAKHKFLKGNKCEAPSKHQTHYSARLAW